MKLWISQILEPLRQPQYNDIYFIEKFIYRFLFVKKKNTIEKSTKVFLKCKTKQWNFVCALECIWVLANRAAYCHVSQKWNTWIHYSQFGTFHLKHTAICIHWVARSFPHYYFLFVWINWIATNVPKRLNIIPMQTILACCYDVFNKKKLFICRHWCVCVALNVWE